MLRDIGQESRRRIRKGAVLLAATGALALSACGDSGDDPTLIFDDLGGGSPNVFVYPGVGATTEDKEPVDTYQDKSEPSAEQQEELLCRIQVSVKKQELLMNGYGFPSLQPSPCSRHPFTQRIPAICLVDYPNAINISLNLLGRTAIISLWKMYRISMPKTAQRGENGWRTIMTKNQQFGWSMIKAQVGQWLGRISSKNRCASGG